MGRANSGTERRGRFRIHFRDRGDRTYSQIVKGDKRRRVNKMLCF